MTTLSLAMIALAGGAPQMGDQATIDAIIREGRDNSQVMRKLTELCTKIGPRLTGSPELIKGEAWALNEFKKLGLKNVHLDEWGEVPVGSSRGPNNVARLITPDGVENMVFTTPAWTNGTPGLVKAEAVMCPESVEAIEAMRSSLAGKWVVMPPVEVPPGAGRPGGGGGFGGGGGRPGGAGGGGTPPPASGGGLGGGSADAPQRPAVPQADLVAALDKLPIAGIVRGSRNELVLTGGTWRGKTYESHPGVPQITVRKSDHDKIVYELNNRQRTVLEISADNRWQPGPVKQYNVVADLVGTEKPDEIVIVSGHFDSWNGPGSQGACDNGTGSMTCLEAARILTKVKARPKRTIRFILWTGEEQGLYGSTAYVKNHADELPKISAVLVDDGGTNYHAGFQGIESQKAIMEAAYAPVAAAFPNLPMIFRTSARMPRGGGSDHAPFNAVGVPGFFTIDDIGRSNYTYLHHTQHDNLSQAIPEYLVQSSVDHAVVAYNLACLPGLLPRDTPPAPPSGG